MAAFCREELKELNSERVRRLSAPAPRYTSYPPANYFHEDILPGLLEEDIRHSNRDLSLYTHIPYCRQRCFFCGCNAKQRRDYGDTRRTVEALCKEMANQSRLINGKQKIVCDIHWGGGTPNFLNADDMRFLGESIRENFNTNKNTRFSVEIDPRWLDKEQVKVLKEIGCRRVSLGVQDTQEIVQKAIGRVQPFEVTRQAVDLFRETGIKAINIDLIYGLPFQTEASIIKTIEEVLQLNPSRLALFGYAHLPAQIPVQRVIEKRGGLPDIIQRYRLLIRAILTLEENGYHMIGMDHFAKEDDSLYQVFKDNKLRRNFNGYTDQPVSDLLSAGPSAISQSKRYYTQNLKEPLQWRKQIEASRCPLAKGYALEDSEIRKGKVIADILTRNSILFSNYEKQEAEYLRSAFPDGLRDKDELWTSDGNELKLLARGQVFRRVIARRYDATSQHRPIKRKEYSTSI